VPWKSCARSEIGVLGLCTWDLLGIAPRYRSSYDDFSTLRIIDENFRKFVTREKKACIDSVSRPSGA
jgi:hypothetical protein